MMGEMQMDEMDRRGLFTVFSVLTMAMVAEEAQAQTPKQGRMTTRQLSQSRVIRFKDLPVVRLDNGGTQRPVLSGTLPTGEFVEFHESMLPAGQMPHPPHKHPNTEVLFILDGKLEYIDEGGKIIAIGPKDIVFSASNIMHGLKNVGTTPANYIVCSISKQIEE